MAHVIIQPSGKRVEVEERDTVLQALEKGGYALPNNCRAGACGECKVKVLSGQFDQGMVLDMALTAEERRNGYGLMCMAKPISDEMEIEWLDAEARPKLFPPRKSPGLFVVVDRREVSPRVLELHLRPVGQSIRYWPGQYVTLGDEQAGVPLRAYSIANAPRPDGEITLQVALKEGGLTSKWVGETFQIGAQVKVRGAYGSFVGDPAADVPILCLAAGTGLAPIMDLAEAALRRGYKKKVTLIFSARTREDVYGEGMMSWWRAKHRKFDYHVTLTREQADGYLQGRITDILPKMFPDLAGYGVYVAGSPAMVDDCIEVALSLGADPKMIHRESFFAQQSHANI